MIQHSSAKICAICGKSFPLRSVVSGEIIRKELAAEICKIQPEWSSQSFICRPDLTEIRGKYVHDMLESERGELSSLDQEVIRSLREHEILSSNVDEELEQNWSFGERLADKIADFGGSWTFIIAFVVILLVWITLNIVGLVARPFDPYPFILLNLVLSCLAALQAPISMMSQKRQEVKDRLRSENDYRVNLKAELEIRQLHEKIDHILNRQWDRLAEIQEIQMEMMEDALHSAAPTKK